MTDNTTTLAAHETPEVTLPSLDITIRAATKPQNNFLGYASVTIAGCYVIHDIAIKMGENGVYAQMPAKQDPNSKRYNDTFHPITKAAREHLAVAVEDAYHLRAAELHEQANAHTNAKYTPPRIADQMAEAQAQADEYNANRPAPTAPQEQSQEVA